MYGDLQYMYLIYEKNSAKNVVILVNIPGNLETLKKASGKLKIRVNFFGAVIELV